MIQFLPGESLICQSWNFFSSKDFLGRFNATPAGTTVPLSGDTPKQWQFQARAAKRDQEIGLSSPVIQTLISN